MADDISFLAYSCVHVAKEKIEFTADSSIDVQELQLTLREFHAETEINVTRHLDNIEFFGFTTTAVGGPYEFYADTTTGVDTFPEEVNEAEIEKRVIAGVVQEHDRRILEIGGEQYVRRRELKELNTTEFLLDSIDNIDMTVQTGQDFRFQTDRELRLSLARGRTRREIIMYEKAREDLDPKLSLGS